MGNKQGTESRSAHRPQSAGAQQSNRSSLPFSRMGNSNTVRKHVDMAAKTGACQLTKLGLEEVPPELSSIAANLRTLDLSENRIGRLPATISQFGLLKSLQLSFNSLRNLPDEIGDLARLETLVLTGNQLSGLPETLAKIKTLTTLTASRNQFVVFPTVVYSLRRLDVLDLSANKITSIPDGINQIQAIEMNLNQNQIAVLSEDISNCPRLKVLRLEENCLEKKMISPRLLMESQIALLTIDGNLFPAKDFPHFDGYDEYQERYTATKKKMG
ncbi:leucine-rich repeat-containing protein 57-like [Watersipora subatra]|uniref:leucine-rich repeat-containing protein 57-like n=1 Tax=Watersipora subatra TaxID=2589382 RepID=UPI00355C969B